MNQLPLATNFTTVNYEVKSAVLDAAYNAMPPEQQAHIDQQVVTLTAEIKRRAPSMPFPRVAALELLAMVGAFLNVHVIGD